jgi:hypothetical protein
MRRFARVVLIVIGAVLVIVGGLAAVLAGPDNVIRTGERELSTDSVALTTSPTMFEFIGPTLHVAASSQDNREVFLGVAHEIDVDDYLDGIAHEQLWEIGIPVSFELLRMEGAVETAPAPPDTRDWWYVQASGPDRQEISYPLGAEPVNVVMMTVDGAPPLAVIVDVGLEIDNLFTTALLVVVAGLALLAIAIFALRRRRRTRTRLAGTSHANPEAEWYRTEERQR